LVLITGGLLRLLGIGSRPIWYDEAIAILRAKAGVGGIFQAILGQDPSGITADQHPPGFFLSLWAWIQVVGDSVPASRLFSVIFGLLTIWIIYLLGQELLGKRKAWIPALFVAISPIHIHYSQEIRMYSLMTAMLSIATYAMLKGSRQSRWYWWAIFAISSAAAQYSHHIAGAYLVCLALIPVFRRDWRATRNTVIGGMGAILLFSPWLIHLPNQIESTRVYWIQKPGVMDFLTLLMVYFSGFPIVIKYATVSLFGAFLVVVFGVMVSNRIGKSEQENAAKRGAWAAYLAFAPPLLLWLISQVWPVYVERALLPSAVFFSVWVGWVVSNDLTRKMERVIIVSVMLVGFGIGFSTHLTNNHYYYADWEEIGASLEEELEPNEVVVHSNKLSFVPMFYYFGDELPLRFVADEEGIGDDTLRLPTQEALGFRESSSIEDAVVGGDGVWFVIFDHDIRKSIELWGLDTHPEITWLEGNLVFLEKSQEDGVWLYHYKVSP
jgi:4-amino-4-deoxy-L-arabinose transferase-like glycosyltransferase